MSGISKEASVNLIKRTALDSFGKIGFFYDGHRDQVLDALTSTLQSKSHPVNQLSRCEVLPRNKGDSLDIFQLASIDDDSRSSVLSNLREKNGIAEIYSYPNTINEYTRVFRYTYVEREENQSTTETKDPQKILTLLKSNKSGTHVITTIKWGIDVMVVLELPTSSGAIEEVDRVLNRICDYLKNDNDISSFGIEEKNILNTIYTRIYSNINEISGLIALYNVCLSIQEMRRNTAKYPISYGVQPIGYLYPQHTNLAAKFVTLPGELNQRIQHYLLSIISDVKRLKIFLKETVSILVSTYLPRELHKMEKQCLDLENKCRQEIERIAKFVVAARHGQATASPIDDVLKHQEQITMRKSIVDLDQSLNDLANKGHFISDLQRHHFEYIDAAEYNIDPADKPENIDNLLILNPECQRVLCSNDTINTNKSDQLCQLRNELVGERRKRPGLRLSYADFTYCTHKLSRMMRLPWKLYSTQDSKVPLKKEVPTRSPASVLLSTAEDKRPSKYAGAQAGSSLTEKSEPSPSATKQKDCDVVLSKESYISNPIPRPASVKALTTDNTVAKTSNNVSSSVKRKSSITLAEESQNSDLKPMKLQAYVSSQTDLPSSSSSITKKPNPAPATSLKDKEVINILLLGETGVGKSTFVNALANYLTFDTLKRAEKNQSVVLIPVSFLITVGDNFDEHIVKFGKGDDANNEDFDHPGQSVTQHCRPYVFDLKDDQSKKLRIIDTPGFGDTRGLDRDDYNMAHILEYIKNLSHLNAVCFLIKPNESRLNIFFRSCLTQLLTLLDPKDLENILFCFTNCRSTFYTPGNTAPLLKKMLTSLPNVNIPFRKDNTFCFDSESFRYLVSLQNNVRFSTQDREDYEMSWTKSATEARRLIQHICNTLKPFHISK